VTVGSKVAKTLRVCELAQAMGCMMWLIGFFMHWLEQILAFRSRATSASVSSIDANMGSTYL
jgi:hypothetical protein